MVSIVKTCFITHNMCVDKKLRSYSGTIRVLLPDDYEHSKFFISSQIERGIFSAFIVLETIYGGN